MGGHRYQFLLPDLDPDQAKAKAAETKTWLLARGIIEDRLADNTLDRVDGHPPGPQAHLAMAYADGTLGLLTNGVTISSTPEFRYELQGIESHEFRCPACGADVEQEYYFDFISSQFDVFMATPEQALATCPHCATSSLLREWRSTGALMQCTNFHVTFWNWSLHESFVAEFAQFLGDGVMHSEGKL